MIAPPQDWWKPLGRLERRWARMALLWCVLLTIAMLIWHLVGRQHVPVTTYRISTSAFRKQVEDFVRRYQVGEEKGIPIVEPPPGDIYLLARAWQWYPILRLQVGRTYRMHISSLDYQHGFSLQPGNLNLMVLPGYDHVVLFTPVRSGEYYIVCNEYCFVGHHLMIGKLLIDEGVAERRDGILFLPLSPLVEGRYP